MRAFGWPGKGLALAAWLLFLLLPACASLPERDQQLIIAAKEGRDRQVSALLEQGADANARETNGQLTRMRYTALMWASYKGHTEVVRILTAHGADVQAGDSENRTALMMAVARGHLEIAAILVASGADIRTRSRQADTLLMAAAREGRETAVKWLLKKGVAVNAANDMGETALMAAALRGHTQTVKALLDAGALTEARDKAGNTALILASTGTLHKGGGSVDTVRLLLGHGADVHASNQAAPPP